MKQIGERSDVERGTQQRLHLRIRVVLQSESRKEKRRYDTVAMRYDEVEKPIRREPTR